MIDIFSWVASAGYKASAFTNQIVRISLYVAWKESMDDRRNQGEKFSKIFAQEVFCSEHSVNDLGPFF